MCTSKTKIIHFKVCAQGLFYTNLNDPTMITNPTNVSLNAYYYLLVYHVYTSIFSLCRPPHICVIVTFLQENRICVIHFLPELSGFQPKSIFMIRRSHSQKYRRITTRKVHSRKSIVIKCMWYIIYFMKHRRTRKFIENEST